MQKCLLILSLLSILILISLLVYWNMSIIPKIEDHNVVLYKTHTKINTLTTDWNTDIGIVSSIHPAIEYHIVWVEGDELFVEKIVLDDHIYSLSYYRANLSLKDIRLEDISQKVWKTFWKDASIEYNPTTGKWESKISIWRDPSSIRQIKNQGYTPLYKDWDSDQSPLYIDTIRWLYSNTWVTQQLADTYIKIFPSLKDLIQ